MREKAATLEPEQRHEWIVLEVGDLWCGVPITAIQEINKHLAITPVHHAPDYVRGVINLRGQIVTVIDLRAKFTLPLLELNAERCIVVVRWSGENVGLLADRIQDIVVTDTADILEPPANLNGVAGTLFSGIYPMEQRLVAFLRLPALLAYDAPAQLV